MRVSIIVTFHRGQNLLRACLESLLRTVPSHVEIIIVMNNADVRELTCPVADPRLRVFKFEKNLGDAAAMNVGAAAATGNRLIFSDYDLIFTDGWFEAVQRIHERNPKAGATGVRIVNPQTLRVLDFGIGFTKMNAPHPHLDQRLDSPLVRDARRVQAMCGNGLTIERSVFEELGGFDETLENFYSDIDFCLRLKDIDRECWVAADAIIYHFGGDFSHIDQGYKASFLKADVKAWFRAKNESRIVTDMDHHYLQSWRLISENDSVLEKEYVGCSLMNVADATWYVEMMRSHVGILDPAYLPSGHRDAGAESLYDALGYDYLRLRFPIAYFVDRFVSLTANGLWWEQRANERDIVVDRHGNIMRIAEL